MSFTAKCSACGRKHKCRNKSDGTAINCLDCGAAFVATRAAAKAEKKKRTGTSAVGKRRKSRKPTKARTATTAGESKSADWEPEPLQSGPGDTQPEQPLEIPPLPPRQRKRTKPIRRRKKTIVEDAWTSDSSDASKTHRASDKKESASIFSAPIEWASEFTSRSIGHRFLLYFGLTIIGIAGFMFGGQVIRRFLGRNFFRTVMVGGAILAVFIRDRFYRHQIRQEIEYNGGRIKKISWTPFFIPWFGGDWSYRSRDHTYFKVRYVDRDGRNRLERCGISLFWGSDWSEIR